jgi:hypothetical protein
MLISPFAAKSSYMLILGLFDGSVGISGLLLCRICMAFTMFPKLNRICARESRTALIDIATSVVDMRRLFCRLLRVLPHLLQRGESVGSDLDACRASHSLVRQLGLFIRIRLEHLPTHHANRPRAVALMAAPAIQRHRDRLYSFFCRHRFTSGIALC